MVKEDVINLVNKLGGQEEIEVSDNDNNYGQLAVALMVVLKTLTEKEQKIIRMRFGLDDGICKTLQEVSVELNITREIIRQTQEKALIKMKTLFINQVIDVSEKGVKENANETVLDKMVKENVIKLAIKLVEPEKIVDNSESVKENVNETVLDKMVKGNVIKFIVYIMRSENINEMELENNYSQVEKAVSNILKTLTPREENVIRLLYGINDGEEKKLWQVAPLIGVTRERIRQIEAKALRKLKQPIRYKKLLTMLENDK